MLLTNLSNRNLYEEASDGTGSSGGEIILSGQDGGAGNSGTSDTKSAEEIAAEAAAIAAAASGGAEVFVDIDDNTDALVKETLSGKYDDLTSVKFNKGGDVVNIDGTVLIVKADLDTSVATLKTERVTKADEYIKGLGVISITDEVGKEVEHKIEGDGSVKKADGTILYTADQLREQIMSNDDYLADSTDYETIYEEANNITGLEFVDDNGQPVLFEENPAGLAQRDLYIARSEGGRIANEQLSQFFNENPMLNEAYYYIKARGSLEGIGTRTNHEGITVDANNEQQHVDLITEAEVMRGLTKESAAKRAKVFSDNDMAHEEAKASLAYMQNREKLDKQADIDKTNTDKQAAATEQEEYWTSVGNIVSSGKVLDYTIPENIRVPMPNGTIQHRSREDFYNYMSQPVKNGLTADQIVASKEPLDVKIFNAFLRFVNNDASYIVNQKVKQTQVKDFKQRFTKGGVPKNRVIIKSPVKKSNDNIAI